MKKNLRGLMTAVLALVFAVSAFLYLRSVQDKQTGETAYAQAQQLASATVAADAAIPEMPTETDTPAENQEEKLLDEHMQALLEMNLDALCEINPQVIGWIRIPGTKIDYPIVQGEDNDHYLDHTWDNQQNSVGSIFMEYRNQPDFSDFNTVIYGHNMRNGSMFAPLHDYESAEHFAQHPYVYILTTDDVYCCEIFSAYRTRTDGAAYTLGLQETQSQQEFLDAVMSSSAIDTGIKPQPGDRIVTLSTCIGSGYADRWVVHARLVP